MTAIRPAGTLAGAQAKARCFFDLLTTDGDIDWEIESSTDVDEVLSLSIVRDLVALK